MQIYTKILIGMVIGAFLGLTLGPNSSLLDKDVYLISDSSMIKAYADKSISSSLLTLPKTAMKLYVLETEYGSLTDSKGEKQDYPIWSKVSLKYTRSISLKDKDKIFFKKTGHPKHNQKVSFWLKLKNTRLESGSFSTFPLPVSSTGDMIVSLVSPLGVLFMRLIKMVIVPLVFSSLLVGIASLGDIRKLGRMGSKTLFLYMSTTCISVSIGLLLTHIIQPGNFMSEESRSILQTQYIGVAGDKVDNAAQAPSMLENLINIVPNNPIESLGDGNMLQIIFFALILGIALTLLDPEKNKVVIQFFDQIQSAMIVIIDIVMKLAPYGVCALVLEVVGNSGFSVLTSLFVYGITVLIGLSIHTFFVYGTIAHFFAKLPLKKFIKVIRPVQLIAFSTSSSSATLPISMECAEKDLGISKTVSSFVLPLGSTVNMDGTALYQGVAAIFIAQVFQLDLSFGAQLGIILTATMASIGAAGVPGAGMVTLALVLTTAGIPPVGIALILGMDRLLDMFRTAVNVTGDMSVTSAIAVSEGESLSIQEE